MRYDYILFGDFVCIFFSQTSGILPGHSYDWYESQKQKIPRFLSPFRDDEMQFFFSIYLTINNSASADQATAEAMSCLSKVFKSATS